MPSGISSSERKGWFSSALWRKNLTRFWPLWGLYGLLWFFWLPMKIFLLNDAIVEVKSETKRLLLDALTYSPVIGLLYAALLAMALFSYLMNPRAAGMLHALPIRREGLFLTNAVSGLAFIALPTLAAALLSLAAQAGRGIWLPGETFAWFGVNLLVTLMFFSFAACCAMFTGHLRALPVFYGVMNVLVIGVCFLADIASNHLLVGFEGFQLSASDGARWFTPIYQMTYHLESAQQLFYVGSGTDAARIAAAGLWIAVCYSMVLTAMFFILAGVVYRYRKLERAGDVVTVGWVRPVFQYGVGICSGLSLGAYFYLLFFQEFGPWAYVVCVAICAVIGAFIARMLLKKSFKVFGEWKGPALLGVCVALLLAGVRMDVLGLQRRLPKLERVSHVSLSEISTYPYDTGSFLHVEVELRSDSGLAEEIVTLHRELLDDFSRLERASRSDGETEWDAGGRYQLADTQYVQFEYLLSDGRIIRRSYTVPITTDDLANPDSYAARLERIANRPEVLTRLRGGGEVKGVVEGTLYRDAEEEEKRGAESEPMDGPVSSMELELTYEQANRLWRACQEDMEAGRMRRYLLKNRECQENCFDQNRISFRVAVVPDMADKDRIDIRMVDIIPEKSMTSLMAALEELGLDRYLIAEEMN